VKPDVVTRVEHIKELHLLNSRLLALIGQLVEPPVPNVQVVAREFDRLPNEGFALVYAPPSDLGPHRSRKDREYYRRHGYGFYPMEHFEIAEMFGRRKHPALELDWKPARSARSVYKATSKRLRIVVTIGLRNDGRGIAKYPAIRISGAPPHEAGLDGNGNHGLPSRPTSWGYLFGGGADHVIYPGTLLDVATLAHEFAAVTPAASWNDLKLDYEIFAEEMTPVTGCLEVRGDALKAAFGSQQIVTWPSA
jgi:hypothetical protein